jgi:APA family basic amino acid/polyamine antiporter
LLVVGTVVGSGIFVVPGSVFANVGGSLGEAVLLWTVGGVLSLLGAITYAELGAMMPRAGGLYVFIRDSAGPLLAFLYGWVLFLVIGAGTVAALAVAAVAYLARVIPLTPVVSRIAPILIIVGLTAINMTSTSRSVGLSNLTTVLKLSLLTVLIGGIFWGIAHAARVSGSPAPAHHPSSLRTLGAAMLAVLWAYEGWQWVTFAAGEVRDPGRAIPRGLVIGTIVVLVVYVLANVAFALALGPTVSLSPSVAADAARTVLGAPAATVVAATIVISIVSSANGTVLTVPRVFLAMARDGVIFRALGHVHVRFRTPMLAVASVGLLATLYALLGTFDQLLRYVVFTEWLFYALGGIAVFIARRTHPYANRPFRVPGYPLTPAIFVLAAAVVVGTTIVTQPGLAAVGLGAVATGVPVFYVWRRAR